jgi:hypothetical protein
VKQVVVRINDNRSWGNRDCRLFGVPSVACFASLPSDRL